MPGSAHWGESFVTDLTHVSDPASASKKLSTKLLGTDSLIDLDGHKTLTPVANCA